MPRPKSRRPETPVPRSPGDEGERLQKVLAAAGIGSRRQCETLIEAGRVQIDGRTVTRLGTRVDPSAHEVRVDGDVISRPRRVYYAVNKPVGVLSTNRDPDGRQRVIDLVPPHEHLFAVGRLDRTSEGLMLVTNDGTLANRLTHPRYGVCKTYRVRVAGRPTADALKRLRQGVHLAEGVARVDSLRVKNAQPTSTELELVLTEGRNREIRRILAKIGHKVLTLRRVALGPLRLGRLAPGAYRTLRADEIRRLQRSIGRPGSNRPAGRKPRTGKSRPTQPGGSEQPAGGGKSTGRRRRVVLDADAGSSRGPRRRKPSADRSAATQRPKKRRS